MAEHADVLIIGGGVIGLTAAYFLAREGVSVSVVDRGDFGQEASWAGAGIIPPGTVAAARTPFEQLRAHSCALLPGLSAELRERTGIDNGWLRCGGLEFLGRDDEHSAHEWRSEGAVCEVLSEATLQQLEPALAAGLGPACYLPEMAQLRNPRHIRALHAGCQSVGVRLTPGCPVHDFERDGSRVTSVRSGMGSLRAGQFIIAAGSWSDTLLETLGWRPGIRPIRGQIALLNTGQPLFQRVVMWGARYLVPRPDGRVLVGSTEEDAGFDKRNTAAAIGELLTLACRLVPGLGGAPLERCWAGLRPGSPDGLPFIGPVPGVDNVLVAAGHYRAGIQLAPATALLLEEIVLGRPPTVSLEPFRLDRGPPRSGAEGL